MSLHAYVFVSQACTYICTNTQAHNHMRTYISIYARPHLTLKKPPPKTAKCAVMESSIFHELAANAAAIGLSLQALQSDRLNRHIQKKIPVSLVRLGSNRAMPTIGAAQAVRITDVRTRLRDRSLNISQKGFKVVCHNTIISARGEALEYWA